MIAAHFRRRSKIRARQQPSGAWPDSATAVDGFRAWARHELKQRHYELVSDRAGVEMTFAPALAGSVLDENNLFK